MYTGFKREIRSRINEDTLEKIEKGRIYIKYLNRGLSIFILSTVFIFPYPVPKTSFFQTGVGSTQSKTVVIQREDYRMVMNQYTSKVEKGFCVFGSINSTHIKIKEVLYNEDPIYQSKGKIVHYCLSEIGSQLPEMYLNPSYKLIGNIHTHPDKPRLSRNDILYMGMLVYVQRIWGVTAGEELNFYTFKNLYSPSKLKIIEANRGGSR